MARVRTSSSHLSYQRPDPEVLQDTYGFQSTSSTESNSSAGWSPLYGGTRLDQDTLQYIHKFYCKDCCMEKQAAEQAKAAGSAGEVTTTAGEMAALPASPLTPQTGSHMTVQQSMDKNKETLKRKLMLRRSVTELVEQGIYPPLKTPPAYAEQRKKLELAKTGDLLRHKIQQRPDRQALVQQHILEDSKIDPSLQERQRLLKKARLADDLNDKLSHRPGPLELIHGNILHVNNELTDAIKDGTLQYSKACFVFDDDSNNSDGASSPPQIEDPNLSDVSSPSSSIASAPETSPILQTHFQLPPITTQSFTIGTSSSHANSASKPSTSSSNGSSNKSRNKKPKPKPQNKSKMIKFHEYKGPASIVKTQPSLQANNNSETPYHIMLEQQQLFLQWQLEFQQQNMPVLNLSPEGAQQLSSSLSGVMMAPAPPSCSAGTTMTTSTSSVLQALSPAQPPTPSQPPQQQLQPKAHSQPLVLPPSQTLVSAQPASSTTTTSTHTALPKVISNLEDMKVADLKAELKKRNLHVSGSKPQLIERLKPYIDSIISAPVPLDTATSTSPSVSVVNNISEMSVASPPSIPTLPSFFNMKPVFSPEESMNTNLSPPLSPNRLENCGTPMSPDEDTSLPGTLGMSNGPQLVKSHFSHSQSSIPMAIDQISRPPSVMSAETAPMEVEQPPVFSSCMPIDLSKSLTNALQSFQLASFNPSQQQVKLQLPTQQSQIQQPQQINVMQQQSLQPQAVRQALALQQPVTAQQTLKPQQPVGSPQAPQQQQYTQAELLQQQQKKIDELQQQLIQLQQFQVHQQKQLTQRQQGPQSPPQFVVGFPAETSTSKGTKLQNTITNSNVLKPMVMGATHLLPSMQAMPTVIMTNNTPAKETMLSHANFTAQSLKLKHKPNLTFAKSPPDGQPFIFTSKQETKPDCSVNRRLTPSPCNGINRTTSLPLDGSKKMLPSTSSASPFYNVHMKEPPKYDEAIKSKQQGGGLLMKDTIVAPALLTLPIKSQAMDDVLEILIRTGELPASAAQEPPPTPKTTSQNCTLSAAVSVAATSSNNLDKASRCTTSRLSPLISNLKHTTSVMKSNPKTSAATTMPALQVKKEQPYQAMVDPAYNCEYLDLNEMLAGNFDQDLGNMDWTNDQPFSGLELIDQSETGVSTAMGRNNMLTISTDCGQQLVSNQVSDPGMDAVDLQAADPNSTMQVDVSDWLDVIMPSTGLTPLSANAPVSFPSDPILTPKSQQEVLDLFNFVDADYPPDVNGLMNWDKLAETGTTN